MKVIALLGGLGNQMFQYAFYQHLKNKTADKIYGFYGKKELQDHNGLELENAFENLELPPESYFSNWQILFYKLKNRLFNQNKRPEFHNTEKSVFYGFFHDLDLLPDNLSEIFKFRLPKDENNLVLAKFLQQTESVSVHIRRGDFLKYSALYGNICTKEYYEKAIDYMQNKCENPLFIFFSDDMAWVKENFPLANAKYVEWNHGKNSYLDMYLMSHCHHNIIANSTFSWWGAYLNRHPDKITIAPERWINPPMTEPHLFPKSWIRIAP